MLHTKFVEIGPSVPEKKIFDRFFYHIGVLQTKVF